MRHRMLTSLTLAALLAAISSCAYGWAWVTAFGDNFDHREVVGGQYQLIRGDHVSVMMGSLQLLGEDALLLIKRPIADDIRFEMSCRAWPETETEGLGVLLYANDQGEDGYNVTFGSLKNTAARIAGPGIEIHAATEAAIVDRGKQYHVIVQCLDGRLTLEVDGTSVLSTFITKPSPESGYDRLGILALGGIIVDSLTVMTKDDTYGWKPEQIELVGLPFVRNSSGEVVSRGFMPPEAQYALDLLKAKRFTDAKEAFRILSDPLLRLGGLAYLYGDIDYHERFAAGDRGTARDFGEFGDFAREWEAAVASNPGNSTLEAYLPAVQWFGKMARVRWSLRYIEALIGTGSRNNPFYHKALLYRARAVYWNGMESANESMKQEGLHRMRKLKEIWPENRILKEYLGEFVPWVEEVNADTDLHPAWAAYLREAFARQLAIIDRFFSERQTSDGQLGGGWGDDVELLRNFVPIAAITTSATATRTGIARLVQGVWTHECTNGYSTGIGDVEHSSEPSADSFPTMLLLFHGDPLYYEYNLASCKTIRDMMMGTDWNGYPRFKSCFIGSEGAVVGQDKGGDSGYHTRPMKHFLWMGWYGNREAEDYYLKWVDGWRNTAMIDAPDKPRPVVPGTIWYPSGDYRPPGGGAWYASTAHQCYNEIWCLNPLIYSSFLNAFHFSGDRRFLEPFDLAMIMGTRSPLHRNTKPPDAEWFHENMAHMPSPSHTAVYRLITGDRAYDEYTRRFGSAAQVYPIDHDIAPYLTRFEEAAKSLRGRLWYRTTEVLSTDRLYLPAVEEVWGAYTGAVTRMGDTDLQTFAVTYETPSADFAALVVENTTSRLRLWFYSFWEEPTEVGLRFWRLRPGRYGVVHGKQMAGEFPFQRRYDWSEPEDVLLLHRGDGTRIVVPPSCVYVIDVCLREMIDVPTEAPDLAFHARDISRAGDGLDILVHNIGSAEAPPVQVLAEILVDGHWLHAGETTLNTLPAPRDFVPSTATLHLSIDPDAQARVEMSVLRITVDPADSVYELTKRNNQVIFRQP